MRCDEEDATDEANDADDGYEHNENNNDDTNDEDDSITLPDIGPEHHLINTPPETQCHPGAVILSIEDKSALPVHLVLVLPAGEAEDGSVLEVAPQTPPPSKSVQKSTLQKLLKLLKL